MNVDQCMTRDPRTCRAHDSLERAAQIMWEGDCGCVPVVDDDSKVIGIITDRDICMAAYTRGAPLYSLSVESTMAREVIGCRPGDSLEMALKSMRLRQVRRLPVLDAQGGLLGMLSVTDVVRQATAQGRPRSSSLSAEEVLSAFSVIGRPRTVQDSSLGFDGGDRAAARETQAARVLQPKARPSGSNSKHAQRSR